MAYSSYVWIAYGAFVGMIMLLAYRARMNKKKTTLILKRWFNRVE